MTCPRCHTQSDEAFSLCPECGLQLLRSISGVMKTSTVLVAAGGENGFYRSVLEVPEPLRAQLIASTRSANSGTILIADRAGREQLTQIIARRDGTPIESDLSEDPALQAVDESLETRTWLGFSWMAWTGAIVTCAAVLLIATILGFRW
jgi:hypothetical protein